MARIQFILKSRENTYTCDEQTTYSSGYLSSGLLNSATFVERMLAAEGHTTSIVHALDNNCIDRLVNEFQPDIVIIEAYWVVPEKFGVLTKLHPKVKWLIRNHSAVPFLATEGIGMDWSLRYMDYPNVLLCCNDVRANREMRALVAVSKPEWSQEAVEQRVCLLPNYYPTALQPRSSKWVDANLNVGCFGAVRPLKNHLIQAVAAVEYAKMIGRPLRFHINATRIEGKGDPVLHNLRRLFANLPHTFELVEHPWMPHGEFKELLRSMDVCLQVSYTETFNIVTADAVTNDVPVVTSDEIRWVSSVFHADPNDSQDIIRAMRRALFFNRCLHFWHPSVAGMKRYNHDSVRLWNALIAREVG